MEVMQRGFLHLITFDNLIRKFSSFFGNDLLILDYVYSNVMIDKAENVKIEILNRAFNLDDIFLTHFVAARVDDGTVQSSLSSFRS